MRNYFSLVRPKPLSLCMEEESKILNHLLLIPEITISKVTTISGHPVFFASGCSKDDSFMPKSLQSLVMDGVLMGAINVRAINEHSDKRVIYGEVDTTHGASRKPSIMPFVATTANQNNVFNTGLSFIDYYSRFIDND